MRNRKVIGIIVAFCFLVVVSSLWILLRGDSNEEQWSEVTNSTVYHLTDGEAQYRSPYYKDLAAAIKAEKIFKRVEAKVIVHKVKMILITNRVYRALDKNGRELYFDETSETNLGVYLEFRARTLAEVGRDLAGGFKFKITRPKAIEREGVKQIFRFFENPLVSK
ncbi:MAG: hypothetical protein NTV62_01410, partial [Candidatus Gribaldobacteria bacterium]|nr:hypothetical protein [Candidatus Gribaldobacteria bacterium]